MHFKEYLQLVTESTDEFRQKKMDQMGLTHLGYGNYKNSKGDIYQYDEKKRDFIKGGDTKTVDIDKEIKNIESIISSSFPNSHFTVKKAQSIGNPHIVIRFASSKEWANNIMENDPLHHIILITGFDKDGNECSKLNVDLATGGSMSVPDESGVYAFRRIKIGWRKKSGSLDEIKTHLKKYFTKAKTVYDENKSLLKK